MEEKEVVLFGVQISGQDKTELVTKKRNRGKKVFDNYMNFFNRVHEVLYRNDNSFPSEVRRKLERECKVPWNILSICKRLGYIHNYETKKWAFTTRINKKKVENILDIANKVKAGEIALEMVNESMRTGDRLRRTKSYLRMISEKEKQGDLFSNRIISYKKRSNKSKTEQVDEQKETNQFPASKPLNFVLLNQNTGEITYCSSIEEATRKALESEEQIHYLQNKKFLVLEVRRKIYEEIKMQINDL